jgi:hypothetical protein
LDESSHSTEAAGSRIDRVLAEKHRDDRRGRCLAATGWHPQTTSTGQYEIIAPERLKITEELGSVVLDYHIDGTRLILSGHGLAQLLGKDEPPQALEKSAQ